MQYELMAFVAIRGLQPRGYPIDLELRGAQHAQSDLLRKGENR